MKKMVVVSILVVSLALGGCAGMTPTQQTTLSGAAIGAGAGALFGAMAGNAGLGAAIGGAVGGTGGYLYGKHKEAEGDAYSRGYYQGRRDNQRGY